MSFSVYDNLLLVHCLPLRSTTVYDLLLTPTTTSERRTLPAFPPVHRARWPADAEPAAANSPPALDAQPPAAVAEELEGREGGRAPEDEGAQGSVTTDSAAEPSGSRATAAGQCPEAAARFVQPCHVVDLESAVHYRCVHIASPCSAQPGVLRVLTC